MTARITAAICTHDRYQLLPRAVDSVLCQSLPQGEFRVIVVDNSPDPGGARAFARRYADVAGLTYVVEEKPGLSNARNVAIGACGTEFVAFIDDDAVAAGDWLERILHAFDAFGAGAAVVGGTVRPAWQEPRPTWLHDRVLGYLSVVDWGGTLREAEQNEWLAGTNVAFRVPALAAIGGFSPRFGRFGTASLLGNEEIEVVRRIRSAGGRVIYEPAAVVEHLVTRERLQPAWFRKRAAWQAVSDYLIEPDATAAQAQKIWPEVQRYLRSLPWRERSLRGLAWDTDDPEEFHVQLRANYLLTVMLLAGFDLGR